MHTNLVVSDNSEDIEKKNLKKIKSTFCELLFNNPKIAIENWLYASNKI